VDDALANAGKNSVEPAEHLIHMTHHLGGTGRKSRRRAGRHTNCGRPRIRRMDDWLLIFDSLEVGCRPRECGIVGESTEATRIRPLWRSTWRKPNDGNASRRV
jgi:hypothetical protein